MLCRNGYRRSQKNSIAAEVEELRAVAWKLALEQLYIGQLSMGRLKLQNCFLTVEQVCLPQTYT